VGGGTNLQEASKILYKKIDEKVLALINCCENEFSIATEVTAGSNPLNPIQQYYAIQEAKSKADYVLVIVHGGHELWQLPSPRMQETYRFFIDAGADAVVNHHQHCYSGYEIYKKKPYILNLLQKILHEFKCHRHG
jgi:poly-gamma-glutamate synthesis protein (capsule biosynthesis protein)